MAAECFLKLEGPDVDGESVSNGHEGEIDVDTYSLGGSNPVDITLGTGAGAGKVTLSGLQLTKQIDLSSPQLFLKCCNGTHFEKATMTLREAGGETPVEYFIVEMKTVFVNDISWGGSSGGVKPSESLNLSCAEYKVTYWSQDDTGAKDKKVEAGWNVKENQAVG